MKKFTDILLRYAVATTGLALIALAVALSLKSNLGTSPVSCPPAVLNLRWPALSVGTLTWMMHVVFILLQMAITREVLRAHYLLQLLAAFVFGYLCDAAIWLLRDLPAGTYALRMLWCLLTVVLTAVGVHLEVIGGAWILAGDRIVAVVSQAVRRDFSTVKVSIDLVLLILSAVFAFVSMGHWTGDGHSVVIREGTLILAVCTGLCMRVTDPLTDRIFRGFLRRRGK